MHALSNNCVEFFENPSFKIYGSLSVRTGVVIHEYTYKKLLVGVLLLVHELYSKNLSSQAWKLGDIKSPSQQNDGG